MTVLIIVLAATGVLGTALASYALYKVWEGKKKRDRAIASLHIAYAEI